MLCYERMRGAWNVLFIAAILCLPVSSRSEPGTSHYQFRRSSDPSGTGKFYMGREIAHVMTHEGADWLERPEREVEENLTLLVRSLDVRPGQVVVDFGAGSGRLTRPLARQVGSAGKVLAVEIQPEMLQVLTNKAAAEGLTNIVPVLATAMDPRLPRGTADLVLLVDVYHELEFPREVMTRVCQALKPGGRLALVEFRGEDERVPIKRLHRMTEAQILREMSPLSLRWKQTSKALPWQHLVIFQQDE